MLPMFKKKSLILAISAILLVSPLSSPRANPLVLIPAFEIITVVGTALMVGIGISSSTTDVVVATVPTTEPAPMTLSGLASRLFSSIWHMNGSSDDGPDNKNTVGGEGTKGGQSTAGANDSNQGVSPEPCQAPLGGPCTCGECFPKF